MIILYDYKLCFLEKPKCGSTSLRHMLIHNKIRFGKKFIGYKSLHDTKFDYYHSHYKHVNLSGAIVHLQKINHNIQDYTFISTLRNPLKLIKSWYNFDINRQKGKWHNKYFQFQNLEGMLKTPHYFQFTDNIFFHNHNNINMLFFDLDNIKELEIFLFKNYNLPVKYPHKNHNKNNTKDIDIISLKQQIEKDHHLYNSLYVK